LAHIVPFKALRAPKDKVALVAARSYQDYAENDLEAQLAFNPYTFLHIINPGHKFNQHISGNERFSLVRNRFLEFKENGTLRQDDIASFYVYKIKTRKHTYCGIIAGASANDYRNNVIKKHEDTLEKREHLFTEYLKTVGFNAEPVLLTYPDNTCIASLIKKVSNRPAEYEFTTTDRVTHYLWAISDKVTIEKIQAEFNKIDALYIADGHHRTSSSNLLAETLNKGASIPQENAAYNFFMSYLIPESDLKIFEFNRMLRDLNGLNKEEFLMCLDKWFRIENRGVELYKPSKKHHFGMYLDGEFYSLYLRKSIYEFTDALSKLDTQILYKTVLQPILGISDLRNDNRIYYGFGKQNVIKMKNLIDSKAFAVGFTLMPVTVDEIKNIANANLTMPPKSTYIEPKLLSGLTIYEF
jgi:uncharacterized protein (DUF1015 family)